MCASFLLGRAQLVPEDDAAVFHVVDETFLGYFVIVCAPLDEVGRVPTGGGRVRVVVRMLGAERDVRVALARKKLTGAAPALSHIKKNGNRDKQRHADADKPGKGVKARLRASSRVCSFRCHRLKFNRFLAEAGVGRLTRLVGSSKITSKRSDGETGV